MRWACAQTTPPGPPSVRLESELALARRLRTIERYRLSHARRQTPDADRHRSRLRALTDVDDVFREGRLAVLTGRRPGQG
jgi:hypothetical protein